MLMAGSQAGSIGGKTSQEVEVGQREQEYSGKKGVLSQSWSEHRRTKMWPTMLKKVLSHVANIDKNNELI